MQLPKLGSGVGSDFVDSGKRETMNGLQELIQPGSIAYLYHYLLIHSRLRRRLTLPMTCL